MSTALGWIGTAFCLGGCVVVGQKSKYGFLCQMVGNLLWLVVGIMRGMPELVFCSAAFASIYVLNYTLWSLKERNPERRDASRTLSQSLKASQTPVSLNGPLRRP